MKKVLKIIGSICLFIVLMLHMLHVSSRIFIPKWLDNDDNMYTWIRKGFYEEEKDSLDLLFIGNSDVYRGVTPIELWDEYGIASYAYTAPGERIWTGYYLLKEALEYHNPQVIIMDVDNIFTVSHSSSGNYRKVFDNMKNNNVKWEAINDPIYEFSLADKLSYYFPIFIYHNRYSELTKEDFKYAFYNYHFAYKGLDMIGTRMPYENGFDYMAYSSNKKEIPDKNKEYLDNMVKLCKENNIELILMELPSAASWSMEKHNAVLEYAGDNDLTFIDFNLNSDETGFDWTIDTSDGGDHLNVYGAQKITKYLGNYLNSNYDLPDHRNDNKYEKWYLDSKKYHEDLEKLESNS